MSRVGARARALALLAAGAVLLAACGDLGPTPAPSTTPSPAPSAPGVTPPPGEDLPLPDEDASITPVLLHDADGRFDRYGSIGQLTTTPRCTAVLLDAGGSDGPAYALTTARCAGLATTTTVVGAAAPAKAQVVFDLFADVAEHHAVAVAGIAWASTRGADLAILTLDTSPGELRTQGLRGWRTASLADLGGAGRGVLAVGIPVASTAKEEQALHLASCNLDADPVLLLEHGRLTPGALRNDCPDVVGGTLGSAVLDAESGALLGILAATTQGGEARTECWSGRPCEVTDEGETSMADTAYAQAVGGLGGCFGADGAFALGDSCPLDPGPGATLAGAPLDVNPARIPMGIAATKGPRTTWATRVGGDGIAWYRAKMGPVASTSCGDESGYGDPVPVGTPVDDPLPTTEQRLVLCVVGGPSATPDDSWQRVTHATSIVAWVDTTPPTDPVTWTITGSAAKGWSVAPVVAAPEAAFFLVKAGPAATTSCAAASGYTLAGSAPLRVKPSGSPVRACAIPIDAAWNEGAPAGTILR